MADYAVPKGRAPASTTAGGQSTAGEVDWQAVERDSDFRELVREKRNFIIPATIFFIVYYFALPILVGYLPDVMDTNVIGHINLAYLFALSQFIMAWVLMALYVQRAGLFDKLAGQILQRIRGGKV
jgi:uncharacterized membrane protein (DUF485 family)